MSGDLKSVKRYRLGDTGWAEVLTTSGVRYYVNKATKETTWHCPPSAKEWLAKHELDKQRKKIEMDKLDSARDKLTEEEQLHEWAVVVKQIITDNKIPPVMTYPRAESRLALDPRMATVPRDLRPQVFEAAKRLFSQKPLRKACLDRIHSLESKIRPDHDALDFLKTYFNDPKWLALRNDPEMINCVQELIEKASTRLQTELEALSPHFLQAIKLSFDPFLEQTSDRSILDDNQFVLDFLDPKNLAEFRKFIQADNKHLPDKYVSAYTAFCASCEPPELIDELIADAWQEWCQMHWQNTGRQNTGRPNTGRPNIDQPNIVIDEASSSAATQQSKKRRASSNIPDKDDAIKRRERIRGELNAHAVNEQRLQLVKSLIVEVIKDPFRKLRDSQVFKSSEAPRRISRRDFDIIFDDSMNRLESHGRWSPGLNEDTVLRPLLEKFVTEDWPRTAKCQFVDLITPLYLDPSTGYLDLTEVHRVVFGRLCERVPRGWVEEWLREWRKGRIVDLSEALTLYLSESAEVSRCLQKETAYYDQVVAVVKDSVVYKRLNADPEQRRLVILGYINKVAAERVGARSEAQRILSRVEQDKANEGMDLTAGRVPLSVSLAEREEDFFLKGGEEEI